MKKHLPIFILAAIVILVFAQTSVLSQVIAEAGNGINICSGYAVYIGGSPTASGGTSPYTYSWSPAASLSSGSIANPQASPMGTTTYCVTITDALGSSASDCVTIIISPTPIANAGNNDTVTGGNNAILGGSPAASGGTPPYSYAWSPSTGLSSTNYSNPAANPYTTTTYCLTVIDGNGCTAASCATITVVHLTVSATANPDTICQGACTNLSCSVTTGNPPYTYLWNSMTTNVCPTTTTSYTVTATDSYGASAVGNVIVVVNNCASIKENNDDSNVRIVQDPINDKITIIINNNLFLSDALISIYNMNGQLILQQALLKEKTDIDISGLAKGMYFVKATTGKGIEVKKFIKE